MLHTGFGSLRCLATDRFVPTPWLVCFRSFERAGLEKHPAVGRLTHLQRRLNFLVRTPFWVWSTWAIEVFASQAPGFSLGVVDEVASPITVLLLELRHRRRPAL